MSKNYKLPAPIDKTQRPRVLITTDLEVDDMNGILLTLLYQTDFDLAGIVWTAGMFHFNGDGVHTLAEITPNYRCEATNVGGTVENAGQLKEFRPVDPQWLFRTVDAAYRRDYAYLSQNDPNYLHPDELLKICKTGNIEFEGDYRFDTEGSDFIKKCILDDDPRELHIMHWGGINTTVRAMISIYETYRDTAEWPSIRDKVVGKIRLMGHGEDHCRKNSGIDEIYPGIQDSAQREFDNYGQYFSAAGDDAPGFPIPGTNQVRKMGAPEEVKHFYKAEWLCDAIKFGHGQLMSQFHLMDDGQVIYGEPLGYQYGLLTYVDWAGMAKEGYGPPMLSHFPKVNFKRYDWMCCQFPTAAFIDIGLRQGVVNRDLRYTRILFEELAARADWTITGPADCNHAPVVAAQQLDFKVKAGETAVLKATATDPDGDALTLKWWVPVNACTYEGVLEEKLAFDGQLTAEFKVPVDAKYGDRFVVNFEVQDVANRPMTRFAQFFIDVVD